MKRVKLNCLEIEPGFHSVVSVEEVEALEKVDQRIAWLAPYSFGKRPEIDIGLRIRRSRLQGDSQKPMNKHSRRKRELQRALRETKQARFQGQIAVERRDDAIPPHRLDVRVRRQCEARRR